MWDFHKYIDALEKATSEFLGNFVTPDFTTYIIFLYALWFAVGVLFILVQHYDVGTVNIFRNADADGVNYV